MELHTSADVKTRSYSCANPYRGFNRLELRFDHVGLPADHTDELSDFRPLAAAFEFLAIGPAEGSPGSTPPQSPFEETPDGLRISTGHSVIYSARPDRDSYLDLEAVSEGGPARAEVWIRVGDRPETLLLSRRLNSDIPVSWTGLPPKIIDETVRFKV